ncbi:genetic competence negative regulator [Terribacillus sp. 7520-G]|uniref:genetic competence negative regulator n=1 Tax=Terribacillus TaxID=459532 RepID=UPI000BA7443B|nr:genetic competence negative regulator [Terribacillus sp. 7520-G]PAD39370.1 adapter protein mecA [Terribacillus sp. 7520-G]
MKLERVSLNQFKIFLTFDDLIERGLTKEDLWHDLPGVHQLFHDMMYEASDELGFELEGTLLVQVHILQAQGMQIIVTQYPQTEDFEEEEDYIEMKVTLDESRELIFSFADFEDIISVSRQLDQIGIEDATVYFMNDLYYMEIRTLLHPSARENLIAVMSEFANPSIVTSVRLNEYGKKIFEKDAIRQICAYFA